MGGARSPERTEAETGAERLPRESIVASLVAKSAEMVTLALLATVVPRALGPSDYGVFATVLTVATLGSLALTLGGPALMTRYVPTVPDGPERTAVAHALGMRLGRSRLPMVLAVDVVAVAAVVFAADVFPAVPTLSAALGLTISVATTVLVLVPLGVGRARWWVARFPVQNALLVCGGIALHRAWGVEGAVLSVPLAAAVVLAMVLADEGRELARYRGAEAAAPPAGAARFGMLHGYAALLTQVVHRGGVLAVVVLGGTSTEAGFAALAVGIALGATYAVQQVFTVSMPHLSGSLLRGPGGPSSADAAEAALRRLALSFLAALVPACVAAAFIVGDAVPRVLGEGYEGAVDAFGPALGVVVLAPLASLLVSASSLRLQPGVAAVAASAAAVVFVVTAAMAVPAWGAAGSTAATLAGVITGTVASSRLLPGAAGTAVAFLSVCGCVAVVAAAAA